MKRGISEILFSDDMEGVLDPSSPAIYQTTTFHYKTFSDLREAMSDEQGSYLYTRGRNPTVELFERKLANLENAEQAKLFSSGISAIAAASMAFLSAGDHVVCVSDCYSWTSKFFSNYIRRFNVGVTFVDGLDPDEWKKAIRTNTKFFFLESPTTFSLKLQDIREVAKIAKGHNIKSIIDNSWATPLFQNPIDYGVDLVVHSCTKYIGGHNDVLGGVVIGSSEDINRIYKTEFMNIGAVASPFESWLLLRGLRTLPYRIERQSKATQSIINSLHSHPKVEVIYPMHGSHPQFELAVRQMSGGSSLFTMNLKTKGVEKIERFVNALKYFKKTIGWGGYESLVLPAAASGSCPEKYMNTVRIYIGLEDPEILIDDLLKALEQLGP